MDKTAIKNFSIWARNKLIADITYKAGLLGITEEGIKDALPQSTQDAEFYDIGTKEPYAIQGAEIKQRRELVRVIRKKTSQLEYKDAYRNVVEEVAYTWFNRLIAIRFMEVNDYMPAHIRVLSSESGKLEPDLVTMPFDAEIEFTQQETEYILQLKNDNQMDMLFRFLFIKQCNALNVYLPKLFEKTSDYTELLLNVSVTDQDGIVYHLIHDIEEDDFNISKIGVDGKPKGQVEIIGWMYQYYNIEPKDEAFALLKKNVKITKERIPAVTQLFTPHWIVCYMVENSLGRLWLEGHEDEELKKGWIYYLDEAEQEADVEEQLKAIREEYKNIKPEEIRIIDPCMGSGHILVYGFDVLMQIYERYGYSRREAAKSIVENNIYGLDIDERAFQLAYFAIMMKARSYSRRFLTLGIEPNLCAIQESNGIQYDENMGNFLLSEEHRETLQYLLHTFEDAKEYGSILDVEKRDYDGFLEAWKQTAEATLENVVMIGWYNECNQIVPTLTRQAKILSQKYDVVVTNPPYMGASGMGYKLSNFVKEKYPYTKSDLFSCCIEKGNNWIKKNGYNCMVTMQSWMFLASFEKMRTQILGTKTITNLMHMENMVMGIAFGTAVTILGNYYVRGYKGTYNQIKLQDIEHGFPKEFPVLENCFAQVSIENFSKIPGSPVAYWASSAITKCFGTYTALGEKYALLAGTSTGDNTKYQRFWAEVDYNSISRNAPIDISKRWYPCNTGGEFRKYSLNDDYVIDWENDGYRIRHHVNSKGKIGSAVRNRQFYFRHGITWNKLSSSNFGVRLVPDGYISDDTARMIVGQEDEIFLLLGFLSSNVCRNFLKILSPIMSFTNSELQRLPVFFDNARERIELYVRKNYELSKQDRSSFETSWDFQYHQLLRKAHTIAGAFGQWQNECDSRFNQLKENEEEINRIFINIYGLQDELTPDVEDKDVTVRKADLGRDIRSFISYAVGCMFGRYSLDQEGLMFAGGDMKDIYAYYDGTVVDTANICLDDKYTFGEIKTPFYYLPVEGKEPLGCWKVDADNIISITDEEYFPDDIVNRFVEFVKVVYGEETLEENLDFIAQALGNKGNTSREVIRNYFLKEFYTDHLKVYQKRPIYWLFDSGKRNGFKGLIYMHRYNADTTGNLRVDYLHRMERIYESEINRMQDTIDNSKNTREVTAASKRKEKLQKQLKECQEYDEKVGHLALSRIEIDLDDGVKVNYEKVQTARDGKKYQVLAKI